MNPWTPARIDMLKRLVSEGASATVIAAKLGSGVSRGAVCGKIQRMGLGQLRPVRPKGIEASRDPKQKAARDSVLKRIVQAKAPKPRSPRRVSKVEPLLISPLPDFGTRHFLERNRLECAWPMWPEEPIRSLPHDQMMVCGRAVEGEGMPYCPAHRRLAGGLGTVGEQLATRGIAA